MPTGGLPATFSPESGRCEFSWFHTKSADLMPATLYPGDIELTQGGWRCFCGWQVLGSLGDPRVTGEVKGDIVNIT